MSCCDEDANAKPREIRLTDLPDETFACMGRMAYIVAAACEQKLIGTQRRDWYEFNELEKLRTGARAKALLTGTARDASPFEELMAIVLKKMMESS